MRAARWPNFGSNFGSFVCALAGAIVLLSCGGDSTGPGGGGASITVNPATDSLALGASVTLVATVTDANGHTVSGASIFWSSENPATATVSSNGVVTGIAIGVVRIAASSNGKSDFAAITVVPQSVASVRVSPTGAAIKVGETVHLQADALDAAGNVLPGRTITWTSSNRDVATVDSTGLVTGVSTGATTITATSEGKTGTSGIAVAAAVAASITVAPTSVTITTGQTSQLTATVKDANGAVISGAPVDWAVDHANIALVSSTGLVTGQSQGSAIVTATSGAVHANVPITITLPPANAVIVSPATVALLVTGRQQLSGTVTDAGGNTIPGQSITWGSSNTGIAVVGTAGLVIAVAPGTATITGTSGAVSGVSQVTVSLVPVRRVTLTPDALAFTQGDPAAQLTVTLLDSAGGTLSPTGRPVTFASNKTGVATVSGTGLVTPVGPGQAVITVTQTGSGLTATATVNVMPVPVASVTIAPAVDTLIVAQAVQLVATTLDGSGNALTGRTIVWNGSDDGVATVSSGGRVTAQAPGTMTVTATSEGKTGTATIVVLAVPIASVVISPTSASVLVGSNTAPFTAVAKDASGNVLNGRVITFASSNTAVATVDATSGVATGVAPGTTTITASSEGKTSNSATLTVTAVPVASVTISPTTQSVVDGSTTPAFTAVTKDAGGGVLTGRVVTWNSSNTGVATINSSGVATGVAPGTTTITASTEGQTSNGATLTVNPAPVSSVTVTPASQTIVNGNTASYSATLQDANGNVLTGRVVTWSSSDVAVATVDNSGTATSTGPGNAIITATSEGISGTATLQVDPVPVTSVTVTPALGSISVGEIVHLSAAIQDANGKGHGHVLAWTSNDETLATVDKKGVVTGVARGLAIITAMTQGRQR